MSEKRERTRCAECGAPKEWGIWCFTCRVLKVETAWLHAHTIYSHPNIERAR